MDAAEKHKEEINKKLHDNNVTVNEWYPDSFFRFDFTTIFAISFIIINDPQRWLNFP